MNWGWLAFTVLVLILYFEFATIFLPSANFDIVGDVPWNTTHNLSAFNSSNVKVNLNVRDFDNRTYFSVGSFIVFSLNITNGVNKTIIVNENTTTIYPVNEFNDIKNFKLMPGESKYFEQDVPILHDGPNRIDLLLRIQNGDEYYIQYYANPATQDQKLTLLFDKYTYWFSLIGGAAGVILAVNGLKEIVSKNCSNCKKPEIFYLN